MTAATVLPPTSVPAPGKPGARVVERIRIDDADWATYERFLSAIGDRPIRCTYDRGRLEIMAPMRRHERGGRSLGRLVETTTYELNIPLNSCGSMTIRREDLERGFEPDECYYIEHLAQVREDRELDFTVDPPPDLGIEVDVTSSSIDRQALYAALRIPELWWRDENGIVHLLHLQLDGSYIAAERSLAFPFLTQSVVNHFLQRSMELGDETAMLQEYRAWLLRVTRPSAPPAPGDSPNGA